MSRQFSCRAFAEIEWFSYHQALLGGIKQTIDAQPKEYILGVEETEYKEHLVSKYTLEPLEVLQDSERMNEPRIEQRPFRDDFGRSGYREAYVFTVQYAFRGTAELFRVKPSKWTMTSYPICVDSMDATVGFEMTMMRRDADEFRRKKEEAFKDSFVNVESINDDVHLWNEGLPRYVSDLFDQRRKHFAAENDFFAAINVSPNPETKAIFTVPTITRRVIPQPNVPPTKQFAREPTMSDEMYEDVLTVLYQAGRAMERKPSLYEGKDEEALRDQFLLFLETRYKATTGTGETFNKSGKTDILLKYEDGTNLFVAECKWWSGEADFHSAINQLFDRYLTWRDSKAALLLFVRNKGFSAIVEKVRSEVPKHPYFVRAKPDRAETSQSFDFHLPNDSQRLVKFAVLLFAFPE
jgi:hypothetical protein